MVLDLSDQILRKFIIIDKENFELPYQPCEQNTGA